MHHSLSALRKSTVTPSTPKMSVRVYIALRGSDSHEASNRLQFIFVEWAGSSIKLKSQAILIILLFNCIHNVLQFQ